MRRYTDNCVARVIPELGGHQGIDRLDTLFNRDDTVSRTLATLKLPEGDPAIKTCLDLKEKVEDGLGHYARSRSDEVEGELGYVLAPNFSSKEYRNLKVSSALLEQYQGETESHMGIQKGAQAPGTAARVLQYVNRFFSWDGVLSLVGDKYRGASMAAHRAEEFGENLARAPHVAGFIKLMLIAIFPWLVFPVVAGYWRVLLWWFTAYFSVLLWAPIWTLLYHVVTGITLSADTLAAMGRLSDGVSLYSANLVTSRINYMYAVYSWLQLLVGGAFTGSALWFIRPILSDKSDDSAPEFVGIGTTAPTAKLTVAGTTGVDGIAFPDGSLQIRAARALATAASQQAATMGWGLVGGQEQQPNAGQLRHAHPRERICATQEQLISICKMERHPLRPTQVMLG